MKTPTPITDKAWADACALMHENGQEALRWRLDDMRKACVSIEERLIRAEEAAFSPATGSTVCAAICTIDEFALESCPPDLYDSWSNLLRYWSEYFPHHNIVLKEHHLAQPNNAISDTLTETINEGEK